jgi:hypothetical protein
VEASVADDDVRVPAGWYPDPLGLPQLRWWDNHAWTEHVSDARQPMVAQETPTTRLAYADPEPETDFGFADDDETADEATVQLSRRARRERERQADEPDAILGGPATAPAFGDPMLSLEAPERDQVSVEEPSPAARIAASGTVADEAPTGASYDLGTRFDDLLGEPSSPRSAFAHASASTATFVPEPAPEPDAVPLRERTSHRAESELRLGTAPVWIMTLLPLYMLTAGLVLLLAGGGTDQSTVALVAMFAVTWVAGLVLAIVDWAQLRRQGLDHPASWAWAVFGVLIYLVARLMRTVRETGTGFGPLLTFLVLGGFLVGGLLAVPGMIMQVAPATFSQQAQVAVESDAAALGAHIVVQCPAVPPMLVQQSMVCDATRTSGDQQDFQVTVSLQRLNGWIDWHVDDWGVFSAS